MATSDAIEGRGITTLTELVADLDYDDIKNMVMHLLNFIAPHVAARDIIRIPYPYVVQKYLYTTKYRYESQFRCR
jgi:hypothetical protein